MPALQVKPGISGCYRSHLMVDPRDQSAYPSFERDNALHSEVIHHRLMQQSQPPCLLDQVRRSLCLNHFSLKDEETGDGEATAFPASILAAVASLTFLPLTCLGSHPIAHQTNESIQVA